MFKTIRNFFKTTTINCVTDITYSKTFDFEVNKDIHLIRMWYTSYVFSSGCPMDLPNVAVLGRFKSKQAALKFLNKLNEYSFEDPKDVLKWRDLQPKEEWAGV